VIFFVETNIRNIGVSYTVLNKTCEKKTVEDDALYNTRSVAEARGCIAWESGKLLNV